VKLHWRPIEDLDITLAALRAEHRGSGSAFQLNSHPSLIGSLAGIQPQTGYRGSVDEAAFSKFNTSLYHGTGKYSAPWFDVKLSGSRQIANAAFNYDFDGSPQSLAAFDQKLNEAKITTAEAQILSTDTSWDAGWLNWISRAYYFKSRQGFNPATLKLFGLELANQNPGGLSLPQPIIDALSSALDPLGLQFPNGDVAFHALIGTESIAGHVQATVKPASWLGLTFGGRYQSERRNIIRSDSGFFLSDGGFSPLFTWTQARDANGNAFPTTRTTNSFKPKTTIDVHPFGDNTLFYASYQEAVKSGTYNTVAIYERPAYVKPEEIRAYEVGAKTRLFDGLVELSAAGFQ
jgi:iron complex outermembrane receptor protein